VRVIGLAFALIAVIAMASSSSAKQKDLISTGTGSGALMSCQEAVDALAVVNLELAHQIAALLGTNGVPAKAYTDLAGAMEATVNASDAHTGPTLDPTSRTALLVAAGCLRGHAAGLPTPAPAAVPFSPSPAFGPSPAPFMYAPAPDYGYNPGATPGMVYSPPAYASPGGYLYGG
jgi:hypothetical protein